MVPKTTLLSSMVVMAIISFNIVNAAPPKTPPADDFFTGLFGGITNVTSGVTRGKDDGQHTSGIGGAIGGIMNEGANIWKSVTHRLDSNKNFTIDPTKLFDRIRDRMHVHMERLHERFINTKVKMANRTISLLDRVIHTMDRQKEKSGNESTQQSFTMFRSFLDALRNTMHSMMVNASERMPKRPIKWSGDSEADAEKLNSLIKNELEREEATSKAFSQLNSALKKLDKEAKTKFSP